MPSRPAALPVAVDVLTSDDSLAVHASAVPDGWEAAGVLVRTVQRGNAVEISIASTGTGIARVALRFPHSLPERAVVIGDAWERAYGDLHWGPPRPERVLPWYWAWFDPGAQQGGGVGVMLRPGAFCAWSVDHHGATLWLDLHNGGDPVLLGDRTLPAATVVATRTEGAPGDVVAELCTSLADDLELREIGPVIGANNWYHAYGRDFDADAVLRDADTIATLASGHDYRPFSVVDAGWARGGEAHGGPWKSGLPGRFDEMGALADRIAQAGCRPGLWVRPAALSLPFPGLRERPGPTPSAQHRPLDLTVAENLDAISSAIGTLTGDWGYWFIKHDFTFFDVLGRHGREIDGVVMTQPGWHHADRSATNAEILRDFYDLIRSAAGDAVVLGCGTPGHLSAGAIDVQRVGCDTSGIHWERTRRMGVNSLALRQPHDRRFFTIDPDCVPSTPATPWERNRQFLDVVARSGAALFVSIDPATRGPQVDGDVSRAISRSLAVQRDLGTAAQPVDVLSTSSPRLWREPGGHELTYEWLEPTGAWLLPVR